MAVKQGFSSHFVRVFGFVSKELWSVLRQPRLIMTLVVGPFLILLIFGLGYTETSDPFRTLIVLENDEARLAADIDDLGDAFGSAIDLVGTTTDRDAGLAQLERGEIELLIVAPEDALGSIENGEKADFTVIHQQVDPIIRQSIELLSRLSVDQINRQVLAAFVGEVQETSAGAEAPVSGLSAAAGGLVVALESDDETAAREERANLERVLETAMEEESSGVESRVAEALGITVGGVLGEIAADLEGRRSTAAG